MIPKYVYVFWIWNSYLIAILSENISVMNITVMHMKPVQIYTMVSLFLYIPGGGTVGASEFFIFLSFIEDTYN